MTREALTPESFAAAIAGYFKVEGDPTLRWRLSEDLQLDSLQRFEVVLLLEDVAGHPLPEDLAESLDTLADVYDLYRTYLSRSDDASGFRGPEPAAT